MARNPADDDDQAVVQYYLVCLIDILGQRQRLQEWPQLPSDGQPSDELVDALKKTVGTVISYREMFETYFSEFSGPPTSDAFKRLSTEQRKKFLRVKESVISKQQFSDTFVFYTPVMNNYGDISGSALHRLLSAAATVMIVGLASNAPIRGAISVGAGMEIEPGNFYGPALATAHALESKVAGYPRVVLSQEAVDLTFRESGFSLDPEIEFVSSAYQVQHIRPLVHKDTDDQSIVDFMGEELYSGVSTEPEVVSAVGKAYRFACSELSRYKAQSNEKLAQRYSRLVHYMESRLYIWGIEKEA